VFNFYRKPPHYNLGVSSNFSFPIIFALILHFAFAIWIYGNDSVLESVINYNCFINKLLYKYLLINLYRMSLEHL